MKNGFPAPNKELQQTKNDHLTGKAPYKFESALATDPSSFTSARKVSMPETSPENNERPLSGCREAIQTAKSASCRWRTMRRPRNPVPPNTVTRREDMTRKYRAALGYAIIFSALPEAKQASAQARRIRRVTPSDEFQACARPSFASGTEGSNPAPSSSQSVSAVNPE